MELFEGVSHEEMTKTREGIYSFLKGRLKNHALADDLTQYVFMVANTRVHKYDPKKGKLVQWLIGFARILILKYKNDEINTYLRTELGEDLCPAFLEGSNSFGKIDQRKMKVYVDKTLERQEYSELFFRLRHEIFDCLPDKYRTWEYVELFDLMNYYELNISKIGLIVDEKYHTLYKRIKGFKVAIKTAIEELRTTGDLSWDREFKGLFE